MNAEILRGFTDAIILKILLDGDSYGYKISRRIIEKTTNKLDIKDATIYLAFKRMLKTNLITFYWDDNNGFRRKYYKITAEGKKYLNCKIKEWEDNKNILDILLLGEEYER